MAINYSVAQVDVDRLFHANPPTLSQPAGAPAAAAAVAPGAQKPNGAQQDPMSQYLGDVFDDDFIPYRGSRHDEFDFALTKVSIKIVGFII